jgi:ubiquitin C-terminal hydrolase
MPNNMNNQMQNNLNMPKHNSQNNMPNNMNNQMQNNLNVPKHNSQNNMPNNMNNQMQNNNILTVDMYESEIEQLANQYFKKYFFKGYEQSFFPTKGLNNVGLTCYMNSTLQFLLHIPELNTFFFNAYLDFLKQPNYKKIIEKVGSKGKLSKEFNNLLKKTMGFIENNRFFHLNNSVAPYEFNSLISNLNPQFARYESNDARDLLIYLLQEMHEELNYFGYKRLKKVPRCNQLIELNAFNFFKQVNSDMNFSIISYLFWGIVKQTTVCRVCNSNLYNFQYFQYLSFPLYSYQGLIFNFYRGLKDYIKPELLSGDNQFFCQQCGHLRDADISSKIFYTSPYLIINLDYGKGKKYIPDNINFGAIIHLTKEFLDKEINDVKYELVAVTTHIGSSGNTGHYIAFCKDHKNIWHKFNDSSHTICTFEETKRYSPYLLLFKKKEIIRKFKAEFD